MSNEIAILIDPNGVIHKLHIIDRVPYLNSDSQQDISDTVSEPDFEIVDCDDDLKPVAPATARRVKKKKAIELTPDQQTSLDELISLQNHDQTLVVPHDVLLAAG